MAANVTPRHDMRPMVAMSVVNASVEKRQKTALRTRTSAEFGSDVQNSRLRAQPAHGLRTQLNKLLPACSVSRGVCVRRAREEPASVLERDAGGVRGGRAVARLEAIDHEDRAGGEIFLAPSAPIKRVCAAGLPRPLHHLAVFPFDVKVDPRMWIGPPHLGDGPGQLERLVGVV